MVVISFDYSDSEGDITMFYTMDTVGGVSFTDTFTADETGISGTSGRVTVLHRTSSSASYGTHRIEIWVEDAGHHTSNRLTHDLDGTKNINYQYHNQAEKQGRHPG
jgi:hypothetical protein